MHQNNEIDAMIAAAKAGSLPGGSNSPILGQAPRIMQGISVNGGLITINELEKMSERAFRELVLGVFVNLIGGVYVPPRDISVEVNQDESVDSEALSSAEESSAAEEANNKTE